jgi:septum formation protein
VNTNYGNKRIILASQSPRRHALLKKLGVEFVVIKPTFDEKLENNFYSDEKIEELSTLKAFSVLESQDDFTISDSIIISADTVVVLENEILGKPVDENNAKEMLRALSGKKHYVVTAISVLDTNTKKLFTDVVKTFVTFCELSDELIDEYVANKKPLDKAGAYGIQELNSDFIANVDGDLENVIGLPTKALKDLLIKAGYNFS